MFRKRGARTRRVEPSLDPPLGEGAEGCAPSCAEREAETTSILQSEWEAKKRSIATQVLYLGELILAWHSWVLRITDTGF